MSHKRKHLYFPADPPTPAQHAARCACGEFSGKLPTRQEVEDWETKHDEKVERIKAHLGSRNPSLKSQRDYYRDMASNPAQDDRSRALWTQLANELDKRVNDGAAKWDEEQLPLG